MFSGVFQEEQEEEEQHHKNGSFRETRACFGRPGLVSEDTLLVVSCYFVFLFSGVLFFEQEEKEQYHKNGSFQAFVWGTEKKFLFFCFLVSRMVRSRCGFRNIEVLLCCYVVS